MKVDLTTNRRGIEHFVEFFLFSLTIGFSFFVLDKVTLAMALVGFLPFWVTASAPSDILQCLISSFILASESSRSTLETGKGNMHSAA